MAANNDKTVEINNLSELFQLNLHLDRRQEPKNFRSLCLELLEKFLPKYATNITEDQIEVERLAGGYSNQTYRLRILAPIGTDSSELYEENQFVIRMYGKQIFFACFDPKCPRLKDEILSLLASEKGFGPKLYGLFPEGQLQKYYPSRNFVGDDLLDSDLLQQSARKLAQYHAMEPPLAFKNWIHDFYDLIKERLFDPILAERRLKTYGKYGCTAFIEFDVKTEFDWITKNMPNFGSPIVFSHNDFRFGNIMVTEDNQVVLCDFEASYFSYRGFDFASFFVSADQPKQLPFQFQNETVVKQFIEEYVKQNQIIYGKQYSEDKNNSVEHILLESQLFSLVYAFFFICFTILNHDDPDHFQMGLEDIFDEKTTKILGNSEVEKYLIIKNHLIKLKLI